MGEDAGQHEELSVGLFELFWDINQQQRINEAHTAISRGAANLENTQQSLDELRAGIDRLILVNRALWELVSEKIGLTEADLRARVDAIDLRDGVADGRMGREVVLCQYCHRPNGKARKLCLYCGKILDSGSFDTRESEPK